MAKKNRTTPAASFDTLLVLFRYFLSEIGVSDLATLSRTLNSTDYEGLDTATGTTYFHQYLAALPRMRVSRDYLLQYDHNIVAHTRRIGERRGGLRLKYFQYLGLLFTEMYLDRYFTDREAFVRQLNDWLRAKRDESLGGVYFGDYTAEQLGKVAFMCATGSGKTLMMHINVLQFLHYNRRARRSNAAIPINRIILVTPNEGMSAQHLEELELSGIPAKIFAKDGIFAQGGEQGDTSEVTIIDINKFADRMGDKTVAVESFEANNLVLVDEAHRGLTSGDVWVKYRKQIGGDGFTFEYSATFKQSLNANARKKEERADLEEYGKSIIMDYSYKYFYNDGYGKDYRIYNLNAAYDDDSRRVYLTGCLLAFFQQMKYYDVYREQMIHRYNIARPLLVFVGNKVVATSSAAELSDVQEVLAFIDDFVRHRRASERMIEAVLTGRTGLVNAATAGDLFEHGLEALRDDLYGGVLPDAATVFADIMHTVFHTDTVADEPRLHVENLTRVAGEIALKIGENGDYFGVINIGDTRGLIRVCEQKGIVARNEEFRGASLFRSINDADSTVNLLIGSRKFTEGWNSWRVSTMGLINFAQSEGSQAIQLFGRGVRLKGIGGNLKRSSAVGGQHLRHISCVETLTVFGVKAQYMETFKKFLEEEGAPTNEDFTELRLPVVSRFDEAKGKRLRVIRVKNDANFKKQARRLTIDVPAEDFLAYLVQNPTTLDCQSKVQSILSRGVMSMSAGVVVERHRIPEQYLPMLDYHYIYSELLQYKNERNYYNINLVRENLPKVLAVDGWYSLLIPGQKLAIDSVAGLEMLSEFATMALKSYVDKMYRFEKERWEAPRLEFADLEADDPNFVDEYTLRYTPAYPTDHNGEVMRQFITDASAILQASGKIEDYQKGCFNDRLLLFDFRNHLYAPLISLTRNNLNIQISPVQLNEGEKQFVDQLKEYTEAHAEELDGKSLFLLRNKSKAGIGFFEAANFYPDYILWIDTPERQYINFIDPKGLLRILPDSPKVAFYKTIKELETRLQPTAGDKQIVLNSFIMSTTPSAQLREWWHMERSDREAMNVYTLDNTKCVDSMMHRILVH